MRYQVPFAEALHIKQFTVLISLLLAMSAGEGAELCHQVLKQAPSAEVFTSTLKSLAKMKVDLDNIKVSGHKGTQTRVLQREYEEKRSEVQSELNLNRDSLRTLLKKHIQEIQIRDKVQKKEEEQTRSSQAEFINAKWVVKNRIIIPQWPNGRMINADHNVAFIYTPGSATLLDLSTGREEPLDLPTQSRLFSYHHLANSGHFLFQIAENSFKRLDLKTKELKPFAVNALAGATPGHRWRVKETADGKSVLFVNGDSEFRLVDMKTGDLLHSGKFQEAIANFFFVDSDTIILINPLFESSVYSFLHAENTFLGPHQIRNFQILQNGDSIYTDGNTLYGFDHASGETVERTFDRSFDVLMEDGPYLWLHTSVYKSGASDLRMINAKDLTDVQNGPFARYAEIDFTLDNLGPDSMVIKSEDEQFQSGIYNKKDLTLRQAFPADDTTGISKIDEQQVTSDGKRIVHFGEGPDHKTQIETWEKK